MSLRRVLGIAICFSLLSVTVAQAAIIATINASLTDRRAGSSATTSLDGNAVFGPQSAGVFFWSNQATVSNVPPDLGDASNLPRNGSWGGGTLQSGGTNFISFCLELTQTVGIPTNYTGIDIITAKDAPQPGSAGSPMGVQGENYLASLAGRYLQTAVATSGTDSLSDRIAAFQLAVWKLDYDGDLGGIAPTAAQYNDRFDLSLASGLGHFAASGGASALAQSWLNAIKTADQSNNNKGLNAVTGPNISIYALSAGNANFQDQLVFDAASFADAPEPGTLAIWAIGGAVGLVLTQRRRKS